MCWLLSVLEPKFPSNLDEAGPNLRFGPASWYLLRAQPSSEVLYQRFLILLYPPLLGKSHRFPIPVRAMKFVDYKRAPTFTNPCSQPIA